MQYKTGQPIKILVDTAFLKPAWWRSCTAVLPLYIETIATITSW